MFQLLDARGHRIQVGEDEFVPYGREIGFGGVSAGPSRHVGTFKVAKHHDQQIGLTHRRQEPPPILLPLGVGQRASRHVDDVDRGFDDFFGVAEFGQVCEPGLRHFHDGLSRPGRGVRIDGYSGHRGEHGRHARLRQTDECDFHRTDP